MKRDIIYLTINLAKLKPTFIVFISFWSWRHFACDYSKICQITLFVCTPYLIKFKTTISLLFTKCWSQHLTETLSNFDHFQQFSRKLNWKIHFKGIVNDEFVLATFVVNHASHDVDEWRRCLNLSDSLCRHWRLTFWTLLMITTLEIKMSWWQHCEYDHWCWFFCCLLLWM